MLSLATLAEINSRVSNVVDDLRRSGLKVRFDQQNVGAGGRIRERINDGIRNSAVILVFISRNSLRSRWVLNELDSAMIREITEGKTITIPILLGRVESSELPLDLQGKRYLDLRHNFGGKYEQRRQELVTVIRFATNEEGPPADVWIPADEELVQFFTQHRFSPKDKWDVEGRDALTTFSAALATGFLSQEEEEGETRDLAELEDQYGTYVLQKIVAYSLDNSDFRPKKVMEEGKTKRFEMSNQLIADTHAQTILAVRALATQRVLDPDVGLQIELDLKNGKISRYRLRPKA